MNAWIKRGLHTALLTGGLLAFGAGVASADANDIEVTAPVDLSGTAVAVLGDATAVGSAGSPGARSEGNGGVLDADVPVVVDGVAVAVLGDATAVGGSGSAGAPDGGTGSVVDVDVPVGVDGVDGVAVAVLGDATAVESTDSSGEPAGGDGWVVDAHVPVTACGTAIGVLGDAGAGCTTGGGTSGGSDADAPQVGGEAPETSGGTGAGIPSDSGAGCTASSTSGVVGAPTLSGPRPASDPAGDAAMGGGSGHVPAGPPASVDCWSAPLAAAPRAAGDWSSTEYGSRLPVLTGLLGLAAGLALTPVVRRRGSPVR